METSIFVLVVEDEIIIHALLTAILTEAGFAVAIAADGEKAIRMLEAPEASYRALLTDINLSPGKATGWDVAKRARELHAEIPVVYMTGAGSHDWPSRGVPSSVLVAKPFAPAQIVTAVSLLLGQGDMQRSNS